MKRRVRVAILGAMLQMSAHAAEQGAVADPSLDKVQKKTEVIGQETPANKKAKAVRKNAEKPSKMKRKAEVKQDSLTETPPESTDQSLQLRGLRG